MRYVDLSHTFEDGMPGFKLRNEDGTFTQYTARIKPFLTHAQTKPKFKGKCSFEITELTFQSVGTYLDSPRHRYPKGRDMSMIQLEEVILQGVVVDVRGRKAFEPVGKEAIPKGDLKGKAVLFNFGWDRHWGKEKYQAYPFIAKEVVETLIRRGVKLVGTDTVNVDSSRDLTRPAHTLFLKHDILVLENMTQLEKLYGKRFRLFAVPLKGKKVASIPVRAFAEII